MSARISRKEIHYVLFKKTQTFWMFGLFFFFYFFYHGSLLPVFFPIWLHDINHISKK
ncbi:MFS transporter [Escherichia coli]